MRSNSATMRMKKLLPGRLRRFLGLDERVRRIEIAQPPLIARAARFIACEMIEGDYLEFGVYEGQSFQAAYHAIQAAYRERIEQTAGGDDPGQRAQRQGLLDRMRFIALDSFEGLPELAGVDATGNDFRKGQYKASEAAFLNNLRKAGVDLDKVSTLPGWFSDTANTETWRKLGVSKAAIVWIDCDLYQSALDALNGISSLVQDGTVLIFDDWFAFKANPKRGEQRAFAEWREGMGDFDFVEFHQEGTWRKSFVAVSKTP